MAKSDVDDLAVTTAAPDRPYDQGAEAPVTERPTLPPIADLISREVRRMGRAWKIEAVKSSFQVVLMMLVTTVLGAGGLIFLAVITMVGWCFWSIFSVRATIEPYKLWRRSPKGSEPPVRGNAD